MLHRFGRYDQYKVICGNADQNTQDSHSDVGMWKRRSKHYHSEIRGRAYQIERRITVAIVEYHTIYYITTC